jgi:hypothetical protein
MEMNLATLHLPQIRNSFEGQNKLSRVLLLPRHYLQVVFGLDALLGRQIDSVVKMGFNSLNTPTTNTTNKNRCRR